MKEPDGDAKKAHGTRSTPASPRFSPTVNSEGKNKEQTKAGQDQKYEGEDEIEHTFRVFGDFVKRTFRDADPGERLNAWLTLILIGCSLGVAIIYFQQLRQMEAATKAASQSAQTAAAELELSNRPWLSVEITPATDLTWVNNSQPALTFSVSSKNVGKSIAKNAQIDIQLLPAPPGIPVAPNAYRVQSELCAHPRIQPVGRFHIFPGASPVERKVTLSVTPDAINSVRGTGDLVSLAVVGCVTYNNSFDKRAYQTFFGLHLIGPSTTLGGMPLTLPSGMPQMGAFEVGRAVPQKQISTTEELFSSNDAN